MKRCIAFLFFSLYSLFSFACSTFLLSKNGQYFFGRNYDWVTGNGMVVVNKRGLQKTSFNVDEGKEISWTSSCGSITFNQYGKEFPNGGMNEKGLVVELMWLSEAVYPEPDERASLHVLQWIQYQLDNCATVAEVIATDKIIRISNASSVPLHYLVADATGDVSTIEFLKGKMVVHRGKDLSFPVLTNTVYEQAAQQIQEKKGSQNFSDNSVDRFATACRMVQQYRLENNSQQPVDYAFTILDKVAQGNFTKWRIVYDISNRQIHFLTNEHPERKTLAFNQFDFSCNQPGLALDINDKVKGAVFTRFTPLTFTDNKGLITKSLQESRQELNIPSSAITKAEAYFDTPTCSVH
ncbi:MAG: linear amide C-N hydrolase [Flavisolibacter sp.]|nr:linear amide C-N hydrolase [Flavisolibacter sp.]